LQSCYFKVSFDYDKSSFFHKRDLFSFICPLTVGDFESNPTGLMINTCATGIGCKR